MGTEGTSAQRSSVTSGTAHSGPDFERWRERRQRSIHDKESTDWVLARPRASHNAAAGTPVVSKALPQTPLARPPERRGQIRTCV
jgi:hypothetical protein